MTPAVTASEPGFNKPMHKSAAEKIGSRRIVVLGLGCKALAHWNKRSEKFHHRGLSSRACPMFLGQLRFLVPKVAQFESAVQTRRCTSAKAKYCWQFDSEQVV